MKKQQKSQISEEANTYKLLAETMDFFIKDMEEDPEEYKEYLKTARDMKNKMNLASEILKKI